VRDTAELGFFWGFYLVIIVDLLVILDSNYNFVYFQILEMNPEDEAEEDGANIDLDSQRKGKCVVLKTSTRQVKQHIIIQSFFYFTDRVDQNSECCLI
jgi:hypothetical protein